MALLEYSLDVSSGGVTSIPQDTWNHLAGAHAPHLSHEFLAALETHRCLGDRVGWHPFLGL
jgi:predicted N-acyltransferase